jgi:hypothetical protein
MIRGGSLFAFTPLVLAGLFGACARVPADTPKTDAPGTTPEPAVGHAKQDPPIPSECVADELKACSRACWDRACLDWCAGEACVTTVVELHACMGDVEGEFFATNPKPELEFELASGEYGDYDRPTAASTARQSEWSRARFATIEGRWDSTCRAVCVEHLGDDGSVTSVHYCADWIHYYEWPWLIEPPKPRPEPHDDTKALVAVDETPTLKEGSSVSLAELPSHPYAHVLDALIWQADSKLRGIEKCVPDLGDETREFIAELRIDPGGSVAAAAVQGGPDSTTHCVSVKLSSAVTLPVRVAREFSRVDLRVEIRPSPLGSRR